jgi:hypothetical protein
MKSEATIILPNMRGGCATVGGKVHTLFRLNNRRSMVARNDASSEPEQTAATALAD